MPVATPIAGALQFLKSTKAFISQVQREISGLPIFGAPGNQGVIELAHFSVFGLREPLQSRYSPANGWSRIQLGNARCWSRDVSSHAPTLATINQLSGAHFKYLVLVKLSLATLGRDLQVFTDDPYPEYAIWRTDIPPGYLRVLSLVRTGDEYSIV